jgi:hypothetical protein
MMAAMSTRLTSAVVEIEKHVAAAGWDQPARLYALVDTATLLQNEPALAPELAEQLSQQVAASPAGHLTSVEQEDLPEHASLDELLSGIVWPPEVAGAALVVERLMLPPSAEAELPPEDDAALDWVAQHPQRQEVRLAVAVLRDGSSQCALRMREHDNDTSVLSGPDLVPVLVQALAGTLD